MNHDALMQHAIAIAKKGLGRTRPNPAVGCVIAKDGEILADGYHRRAGEDHAEVDALKKLAQTDEDCVMYITLEPCSIHGRTPPCTDAILATQIQKIFIGTKDTNPNVNGAGIQALRDAGREVTLGVLEESCRKLNLGYFSVVERGRPWIAIKYAMSADGKIATRTKDSKWITGEKARQHVGKLRDQYDAICVGTTTLVEDNPKLTARLENGRDPVRVLFDRTLRTPLDHVAFDGSVTTILFTGQTVDEYAAVELKSRGINMVPLPETDGRLDLDLAMKSLLNFDIGTVLVEGGGETFVSLAKLGLIDEVYTFIAPKLFVGDGLSPFAGEGPALMSEVVSLTDVETSVLGDDLLIRGFWPKG